MRKDHHKVITERERRGSGNKYHDYRHTKGQKAINDEDFYDFEESDVTQESPKLIEPMRRPYKQYYMEKEYSDMTSGIKGFVRKNVGRKWDDVFSEFCAEYDQRSVLTKHLFQHLKQHVCTKVFEKEDGLYVHTRWHVKPLAKSWEEYYVDPKDGILKHNDQFVSWRQQRNQYNKPKPNKTETRCVVDKFHEYHKINGTWFLVTFVELPGNRVLASSYSYYRNRTNYYYATEYPDRYDILEKKVVSGKRYAASKRTASKKEIRDHQLNVVDDLAA